MNQVEIQSLKKCIRYGQLLKNEKFSMVHCTSSSAKSEICSCERPAPRFLCRVRFEIEETHASSHVKKPKLKVNGGGCQTHLRGVGPKGPTLKNFAVRRLSYNNCQR